MTGPGQHPNTASHVLACRTCLDREERARLERARLARELAEDERRIEHIEFDEREERSQ